MAFDPDAYLAAKSAPAAGFNPDAYLASKGAAAPAEDEPGIAESFGRGALQGVTFGFGDEIQGALESIFTDKTYQQARDAARQANARAQAAHSRFYGAGEIGGGIAGAFVPGLDIGAGASAGTVAAKSALAGGLSGLGGSEATDAGGIAKDVAEGAGLGAAGGLAAHGLGAVAGKVLGGAEEKATRQAVKGLAAGEGKVPGAANSTKLVEHEGVPGLINEPVGGTTIAREAYRPAEEVQPLLDAKKAEIGNGLDEIYDRADQTSGGVKVSDLVKHYDDQIAELSKNPEDYELVQSLEKTRDRVIKAWAPRMAEALESKGAKASTAAGTEAIQAAIKQSAAHDAVIPSSRVRAFATELQERGATNETNPKLATQIRQQLGSMTRDFVNGHVGNVLGPEDRATLEGLNARYSAAATIDRALEDRAAKEAGGRVSQAGSLEKLLGHGGLVGAGIMAAHGNIPGAVASLALPKVIAAAPRVGRYATTQAAKANQILQSIVEAADCGVPWAQAQLRMLRSSPVGAARLAQLAPTIAAPVDQEAQ